MHNIFLYYKDGSYIPSNELIQEMAIMKLIRAIIRPESTQRVIDALEHIDIYGMTRMNVTGRGREMGISFGEMRYTEIPKEMLMIEVPDQNVAKAVSTIMNSARTASTTSVGPGTPGDGKIFVSDIVASYIIRTGQNTRNHE